MSSNDTTDDRDASLPIDNYDDLSVDDLEDYLDEADHTAEELHEVRRHECQTDDTRKTAVEAIDAALEDAEAQAGGPDIDPADDPAVDETTDKEPANPHGQTEDDPDVGEQDPRADATEAVADAQAGETTRTGEPPDAQPTRAERNQAAQTPGRPSTDAKTTRTTQSASATDVADQAAEETPEPVEPVRVGDFKATGQKYSVATSVAHLVDDFALPDPSEPGAPDTLTVEVPGAMGVGGVHIDAEGSYEFPYAASEAPPSESYSAMRLKRDIESENNHIELSVTDPVHPHYDEDDDELVGDVVGGQ